MGQHVGAVSFDGGDSIDNGFSAILLVDYDNGHAMGPLHFCNDRKLDADQASSFFCENCLNEILLQNLEQCFGVGTVNLSTKETQIFEENISEFILGDFFIDCNLKEPGEDTCWIDLEIFFRPAQDENES